MSVKRTLSTGLIAAIAAGVVALAAAITWAIIGMGPLFITNGLSRPIIVKFDGRTVTVPAESMLKVDSVRSGTYVVEVTTDQGTPVETALIFSRGGRGTLIYNPGGAAPVVWERIEYSRYSAGRQPESRVYCGQTVLDLDDVDYPFTSPPSTISTKGGGSIYRTALVLEPKGGSACISWAYSQRKNELVNRLFKFVRGGEPEQGSEPDDFVTRRAEVLAALAKTPEDFLWRRAWLDLHEQAGLEALVHDKVKADAEAADADATDLYLYSRLLPADDALDYLKRARAKFPQDPYLAWTYAHLLSNTGQYANALSTIDSVEPVPDWKSAVLSFRVGLLMHLQQPVEAYAQAQALVALPPTKYWKPDLEEALLLASTREAAGKGAPLDWSFLKDFSRWRAEAMLEQEGTTAKDPKAQAEARLLISMTLSEPEAALRELSNVSELEVKLLPEPLRLALWLEAERLGADAWVDALHLLTPTLVGSYDLPAIRHYVRTGEEHRHVSSDGDAQRAIYRLARIRELQARGQKDDGLRSALASLDVLHGPASRMLLNWPKATATDVVPWTLVSGN